MFKLKNNIKEIKPIPNGFASNKKPMRIPTSNIKYKEILLVGNLRGLFGELEKIIRISDNHSYAIVDTNLENCSIEGRYNLYWLKQCMEKGARLTIIENLRVDNQINETYFDYLKLYMLNYSNKKICESQFVHMKVITDEKGKFNLSDYVNKNMKNRFDICIMNAPYANGLHEKFEITGIDLVTDEIIWIGPLTWLLGKKPNKHLCDKCNQFYTSIQTIDPNYHFDAKINQKLGIVLVNKKKIKNIEYNGISYNSCYDIRHFSDDLFIMSAYRKIKPYSFTDNVNIHVRKIYNNGRTDFGNCRYSVPNSNDLICRLSGFAGNNTISQETGEFWAIHSRNKKYEKECGTYAHVKESNKETKHYIKFDSEIQLKNFWKFIHTDFSMLCLYFIKTNLHIDGGELNYLPWLDWNNEWDDMKLFNLFNLNKQEVERLYQVIPNYFGNDREKVLNEYKDMYSL